MSFTIDADRAVALAEALRRLTAIKLELHLDVRAYGDIDVDVSTDSSGQYMRLAWSADSECYVLEEPYR